MDNDGLPLYPQTYSQIKMIQSDDVAMNHTRPMTSAPPPPVNQQLLLGPENTIATCPFCSATIKTAVRYTSTPHTHVAAALWSMICCCCCLPYCMDSAKNADHYCPNCQRYIGTYHR